MKVTQLNSASVLIEDDSGDSNVKILCDPWLEGEEYIGSWAIYPPYDFKMVDGLITNFHQPKSTLLMMVSAFADPDLIKKAYREAKKNKYRFLSYGDAMLII